MRAERDGCIEAVNAWLGVARAMVVSIPAGVEPIETECGTREPVYQAVERTVVASDVKKAEMLLTRSLSRLADCGTHEQLLEGSLLLRAQSSGFVSFHVGIVAQ
jgi:hypothetical protein